WCCCFGSSQRPPASSAVAPEVEPEQPDAVAAPSVPGGGPRHRRPVFALKAHPKVAE
ncbi:MAG: hypothetical protein EORIYHIE_001825, partial [Candidatus Fervidibacter sp.]